jgi:hypothetical protein
MAAKELEADFRGHRIVVRNSWSFSLKTEATLSIDGRVVDTNPKTFSLSPSVPVLRGAIASPGREDVVEVFIRSVVRTRIKICVNGTKIAGDLA